jgi:hypothetical protein
MRAADITRRNVVELKASLRIRLDEPRRIEHQQQAAHVLVNLAVDLHETRLVERDQRTLFVLAKAAEVEPLRLRIREHVVEFVVVIRERHLRAGAHGADAGSELIALLTDVGDRRRRRLRIHAVVAIEIDDCPRRIGIGDRFLGARFASRWQWHRFYVAERDRTGDAARRFSARCPRSTTPPSKRTRWRSVRRE